MKKLFIFILVLLMSAFLASSVLANRELKQSETANVMMLLVNATDKSTGETGLSPTITISKDGGAFAAPNSGAVTERGSGWYSIALDATDTGSAGDLIVNAVDSTGSADPAARILYVVANIESDTYDKIDTEVAAIKTVTDNMPDSGALTSIAQEATLNTAIANIAGVQSTVSDATYGLSALDIDLSTIIANLAIAQADLDNTDQYKATGFSTHSAADVNALLTSSHGAGSWGPADISGLCQEATVLVINGTVNYIEDEVRKGVRTRGR